MKLRRKTLLEKSGCQRETVRSFLDKYYPEESNNKSQLVDINPENFYLYCKFIEKTQPFDGGGCSGFIAWRIINWVAQDNCWSEGETRFTDVYSFINPDVYDNAKDFSDLNILACIFSLQAQGVM